MKIFHLILGIILLGQPLFLQAAEMSISGKPQMSKTILITLPLPLSRYQLEHDPIFSLSLDLKNNILALPLRTTVNDNEKTVVRIFINGKLKGDFDKFNSADFTQKNSNILYYSSNGNKQEFFGLPKVFKGISRSNAERMLKEMSTPEFLEKLILNIKTSYELNDIPEEEIDKTIKEMKDPNYQKMYLSIQEKALKELEQTTQPIDYFFDRESSTDTNISAIFQNNSPGSYLIIFSPGFVRAQALLFKNGALASRHDMPLYFHVEQNKIKTKFLYRGQKFNGMNDADMMAIDDGIQGPEYQWISQPTYGPNDEVMYVAVVSGLKNKNDKKRPFVCKAIIGKLQKDLPCNDLLFFYLTFQSPYFRFPIMSSDGKTTIYPELTKSGVYEKDDFANGIQTPFTSRLIVNGTPLESHPFIDKPFFTKKGLALLSHTEDMEEYVEWNGKKSEIYRAIGTNFIHDLGFRGFGSLYAALTSAARGDLGVEDIKPEIVVSPDGNNIAFAGYGKNGWTVVQNMQTLRTHKYVDQLIYSPDSKHLAYVAIDKDFEPLSNQGLWMESSTESSDIISNVVVDGKSVGQSEKILWLQYAPGGMLTYVGLNQKKFTFYVNGKAYGDSFDRILMPPRFKEDAVEIVVARSEKILLLRQSLAGMDPSKKINETTVSARPNLAPASPKTTNSQSSITFIKSVNGAIPSNLKPIPMGAGQSPTFFTDGKDVFALSVSKIEKKQKTYNVYKLEGESLSSFRVINDYYAMGRKAYSSVAPRVSTMSFQTDLVTYNVSNVAIISEKSNSFMAIGRYATDGESAFYLSEHISADIRSFRPLNPYFAKDKFSVFANGRGYLEADIATFQPINDQCGKDKKATYCYDPVQQQVFQMPLMDNKTFKYFDSGIAMDKNKIVSKGTILTGLDVKTFKFISHGDYPYLIDKNGVYKLSRDLESIKAADPSTFHLMQKGNIILQNYAADKNHIYYYDQIIPGADPATFSLIQDGNGASENGFAKDSMHVYWGGDLVPAADAKTFKLVEPVTYPEWYGVDAQHVFHGRDVVKDANPRTFQHPVEKY